MIKNIKPYKMKQCIETNDKLHIKSFPGASVGCLVDYVKHSLKFNPDTFLLHCETNDLRSDKISEEIETIIINLAEDIKSNENNVIISSIITSSDALSTKSMEVNHFLKGKCSDNCLIFCDNSNISEDDLNASGLHLKNNGTISLANNFLNCLNH